MNRAYYARDLEDSELLINVKVNSRKKYKCKCRLMCYTYRAGQKVSLENSSEHL